MKTTKIIVPIFVFSILSTLTFSTVYAEVCVKPTPPVANSCYKTVTTENQVDQDSRYIYIEKITKQVAMKCGPSSDQIKYEADMVSYNVCLQVNANKSGPLSKQSEVVNKNVYTKVCAYPSQPESQVSQRIISTASFTGGLSIRKYEDGTYAAFLLDSQYIGEGSLYLYDAAQKARDATDKMSKIMNSEISGSVSNQAYLAKIYNDIGISYQQNIDKKLSDKNNCPAKIENVTCILNAALDKNNICRCDEGFGGGSGKNEGKCVPIKQAWQEWGLFLHGNPNAHKTTGGYECNEGYLANTTNDNCIQVNATSSYISTKNTISSFTRTLKKGMSGEDVKQLQILLQKLNYLSSTQVPSTYFGSIANSALIRFQKDNKIRPATGSFGPTTQARLILLTK